MKKYILINLFVLIYFLSPAQKQIQSPSPPFGTHTSFISFGFGGGHTGILAEAGMRKSLKNSSIVLNTTLQLNDFRPLNTPADYDPGATIFGRKSDIRAENVLLPINFAKEFYSKSRRTLLSAEVGPSLNLHQLTLFMPVDPGGGWLGRGSNYSVVRKNKFAPGASLRLSIATMVSSHLAIQLSGYSNFNRYQNFQGVIVNFLVPLKNDSKSFLAKKRLLIG